MKVLLLTSSALLGALPLVYGNAPSAGDCGCTSVSTVPGCFGVPACAYVIASDQGANAACSYNYCNCGGTPVPLLPSTVSGSTTLGCGSYTTQPTQAQCPTASPTIPSQGPASSFSAVTSTTSTKSNTCAALSSSKTASTVQTLTEPGGSTISLTLPSASPITGKTTITTDGSTLTVAPVPGSTTSPAAIIIDGSTIPIPSSQSTVAESDGSTLVVGPSAVVENSQTIPIPTQQTTITTNGLTLTFASGQTTSSSQVITSIATTIQSAPSATRTPAITPPPPGRPGSIPTTFPSSGSKEPQVAVTISGDSYILPHTLSVEILQSDGSFITLKSDSVISGTASVSVANPSSATSLSVNGLSIRAGPEPTGVPVTGGASGFTALINSLESLAGNANFIVNTLDAIGQEGVLWSGGGLSDTAFSSGVGSALDSVTGQISQLLGRLDSTVQTYESDVYEMTDDGIRRVFQAQTGGVEEFDLLNSLRKLVRDVSTLRNDVVLKVKDYWKQGTAAAAALAAAEEALRNFGSYNWGHELKKHTTSTTATNTTMSETQSSSSTTTSSRNSATPTLYWFRTKEGTDLSTFESYIKTLPDGGDGVKVVYPLVTWQSYMTNITAAKAEEVAQQPFVKFVSLVEGVSSGSYGAIPPAHHIDKRANEGLNLKERKDSDQHLRVISQGPNAPLSNYIYDPLEGSGQTIYVLDSGFNIDHDDFTPRSRIRTKVIPNSLMLAKAAADAKHAPEDITDYSGHGTLVASVAGGVTHGVASRADLVLIKFKQAIENPNYPTASKKWIYLETQPIAMESAWTYIINDVLTQRRNNNLGKFIVNLSYGFPLIAGGNMQRVLEGAIRLCWEHDIIVVLAAGNNGALGHSLNEVTPQSMSTAGNALITVGGVHVNGVLADKTTLDSGHGGSLTVYAVSENVVGASFTDNSDTRSDSGTSFAAPAVAGLAAYFASLPALEGKWTAGSVALEMKNYIKDNAHKRIANPVQNLPPDYSPVPPADSIKVAYNLAAGDLCDEATSNNKRAVVASAETTTTSPPSSTGGFLIVSSGTILVSSLSQSYCYNTNSPTASTTTTVSLTSISTTSSTSGSTTTTATTTTTSSAAASPSVNIDQGILRCGTRTDPGNSHYFFTLGDIEAAKKDFCGKVSTNDSEVVFGPNSDTTYVSSIYYPPDNLVDPIKISALWNSQNDAGCPVLDMNSSASTKICLDRVGIPIENCDTSKNDHIYWKQGGKFYRDCITWEIEGDPSAPPAP